MAELHFKKPIYCDFRNLRCRVLLRGLVVRAVIKFRARLARLAFGAGVERICIICTQSSALMSFCY